GDDLHDRADDHAGYPPVRHLAGRLDGGHQGPEVDRPVRAHARGDRGRGRHPDVAMSEVSAETPAAYDAGHHADVSGGWLRPAVFGAMDGLVTNIALIAGVGGGGVSPHTVVLTGFAGLVAGAVSMGLGEYTSVRTQNDQVAHEVAKERAELERHPEVEAEELAGIWIARGLPASLAR